MLVSRQQDWIMYPEQVDTPAKAAVVSPRPDTSIKRNYMLFVLLIAVAAMLVTIQNEMLVRAGYDLVEMKGQMAKMEKENELLRLDIAKLKSPDRIQQIATKQLGMIVPAQTYYASGKTTVAPAVNQTARGISIVSKAEASKSH